MRYALQKRLHHLDRNQHSRGLASTRFVLSLGRAFLLSWAQVVGLRRRRCGRFRCRTSGSSLCKIAIVPGLEGWQLFSRFAAGALVGIVSVLVLSSVLNASMAGRASAAQTPLSLGLDGLRHDTYLHLLVRRVAAADNKGEGR